MRTARELFGLNRTGIMAVLNLTPDSFSDGGRYIDPESAVRRLRQIESEGAHIIDIGCESSRPGAEPVGPSEEIRRLESVLPFIQKSSSVFSIDTYKPDVARFALEHGFHMINDIRGGGSDGQMLCLSAEYHVPIVIMHMQGNPQTMQKNPQYNDIIADLITYFNDRIRLAKSLGVTDRDIILDPGIGFGKTFQDNDRILRELGRIKELGHPVLIGASRKSFLQLDSDDPEDRLAASLSALTIAIQNGADFVRVHDVLDSVKCAKFTDRILGRKPAGNP